MCLFGFQTGTSGAQCITGDSVRAQIIRITSQQQDYPSKIVTLQALREQYLKCHTKSGSAYAEVLHRIGDFYTKDGDLQTGIAYTRSAAQINEKSAVKEPFLCNSYYNLAIFYGQLNLIHLSNTYFGRSINAGRQFVDKYAIVAMAHAQLAYSFFKAGDYQQAKNTAFKGLYFSTATKDSVVSGALWGQKAQAETELGDFASAKQSILAALALLGEKSSTELASAYSIYAIFLNATGKPIQSLAYYRKAYLLNKQLGNLSQCANDLNDLGNVYGNDLDRKDQARKCYLGGLIIAGKIKNSSYQLAGLYENFGVSYMRQHDYSRALLFFQKGLNALPVSFTDSLVTKNPTIAMLSTVSNDYYVSTLLGDKARSLLALYKKKQDPAYIKAALQTFLLADRSIDMMRWKQRGELSKLLWRSQTRQLYEKAIETCYLLAEPEDALYFFLKKADPYYSTTS